jgi:hypothetical protein
MDNNYNGITLYQIDEQGNLQGTHTNEFLDGNINLEIAHKLHTTPLHLRKKQHIQALNKLALLQEKIIGSYSSTFFKGQNQLHNIKLDITAKKDKNNTYHFLWTHNKKPLYKGIGYLLSEKQMVVHLWEETNNN